MNKKSVIAKRWLGIAAGSVMAMSASVAQAAIAEVEGNDTFATANVGGNTTLTGTVGNAAQLSQDANLQDVDIWSFDLLAGQTFSSAISYDGLFNAFDANPVMTLFWDNGTNFFPVAATDPQSFGTSINFTPWASGEYFLAVTADFNQGVDAFGNFQSDFQFLTYIFDENDLNTVVIGTPFDHFHGMSFTSFDYVVTASGASVVPVPAAVWLFGSGLLGLVGVARRRGNKA